MPGEGPPLPNRFPCLCRAIYSWGGETKRDLGFVEGDLIECLNAGDGQWWMGKLRRNKTVGLFPSNFVEILDEPIPPSRPASRVGGATSPIFAGERSYSRTQSPAPGSVYRAASPQPSMYERGGGRSPSPIPYHQGYHSRGASPNPYMRTTSPNPYMRTASPNAYTKPASPNAHARSPSPNPYRAASPAPSTHYRSRGPSNSSYQRVPSPNPYMNDASSFEEASPPPPPPPPHRYNPRALTPSPMPDGRHTPNLSTRGATPTNLGNTPSPLRSAMEDVMESLQHMSNQDDEPHTPEDPWSPEAFGQQFHRSPRKITRAETSMGITGSGRYTPMHENDNGIIDYPEHQRPPVLQNYTERMEDRLRRFQLSNHPNERLPPEDDEDRPPAPPPKHGSFSNDSDRPTTSGEPSLRSRKSIYDLRNANNTTTTLNSNNGLPSKMIRPRPLSRTTTVRTTTTTSTNSNSTRSTAATSASIMSGLSAGGFSATSAGSLARRKARAISVIEGSALHVPPELPFVREQFTRSLSPPSAMPFVQQEAVGGRSTPNLLQKRQTWGATDTQPAPSPTVLGGLAAPKSKKTSFFKKIYNSAKTSTASARSVATGNLKESLKPKSVPDGINAIAGGKSLTNLTGVDWVQVRRDVNRSNTLSRNERLERQEKQQMMDHPVLRPVDALDEDVDGDEAGDGSVVLQPADFDAGGLALVDKAARFVNNLPPLTTPESLANHHVCRPYRSDSQRLRAIFTWCSEKLAWEHPSSLDEFTHDGVDTRKVIAQKRGNPEEIAAVVAGMCSAVGIHCEVVRGYLKAPGESIDVQIFPRPNHFWNAVIVDNEWRFMDCSLASPTHPKRGMYSTSPNTQAEFFWFLTKPCWMCWTHVPEAREQQHMIPPLPAPILLALPTACPSFFKNGLQMVNFDTSLLRIEDLEVVQVEFSVPVDVECVAEVEVKGFAIGQDGDVFESGDVVKKRTLCQVAWERGVKIYRVKAVLPGEEGMGVLKVYAGKRGLMHSVKDNPHALAFALPIIHTGENPPYDFLLRHPTPHAQRHDLYVSQPQCARLAVNHTFVFAVRQHAAEGPPPPPSASQSGISGSKPAKLALQSPSGKIVRLMKKVDPIGGENGMVWETIVKCGERGQWRALVLADRSARWCVYAEWTVL
ncbi:hypothetical protein RUND412_003406 [Rhizina undulata]